MAGDLLTMCLCSCEMDVITDVSVMVMSLVMDDARVVVKAR